MTAADGAVAAVAAASVALVACLACAAAHRARRRRRRRRWSGAWNSRCPRTAAGRLGTSLPIGLGQIGDIEFWAPNRGLLITRGNGTDDPPGRVGLQRRRMARARRQSAAPPTGASRGPGRTSSGRSPTGARGRPTSSTARIRRGAPLEDNTLCHFAGGQVVASYAHPAFEADSYQAMHAGGLHRAPPDCWFGGDALPEPQIGAFHLHWNGSALEAEPYPAKATPWRTCSAFEGAPLRERARRAPAIPSPTGTESNCPVLHTINPEGVQPTLPSRTGACRCTAATSSPTRLTSCTSPRPKGRCGAPRERKSPIRRTRPGDGRAPRRAQLDPADRLGTPPRTRSLPADRAEEQELLGGEAKTASVSAIAAEPGTETRGWRSRPSRPAPREGRPARRARAHLRRGQPCWESRRCPRRTKRRRASGQRAPRRGSPVRRPKTAGWRPRRAGCSTSRRQASGAAATTRNPGFARPDHLPPARPGPAAGGRRRPAARRPPGWTKRPAAVRQNLAEPDLRQDRSEGGVPLLSHLHSRLIHGSTLELSFHLAVKARMRLLAKRRRSVVASTPTRTLAAGNRRLLLRLNRAQLADEALAADPRARPAAD